MSGAAIAGDNLPEEVLFTDDELDELVAPVALYPDALLAQVLVASTYPLQIIKADRIVADSADLSDEALQRDAGRPGLRPERSGAALGLPDRRAAHGRGPRLDRAARHRDAAAGRRRARRGAADAGRRPRHGLPLSSNDAQTVEEEDGQIYIEPSPTRRSSTSRPTTRAWSTPRRPRPSPTMSLRRRGTEPVPSRAEPVHRRRDRLRLRLARRRALGRRRR